ncbi:MAG: nucleoside-diphosphate sugar epimerase [Tenericutes bacterium HGW-Tenericutes-2]|jgi:FlaA1/EpsC-like NDP-sugar epimerase|nr:MAG: nucleoside-diphosphate sugar epimerase [Tenericutes bacterium HGW-Tenericutes-2]
MKQLDFRRFLKLFKYAFFDAVMITVSYLIAIFMFMVLELPLDQYALYFALPGVIIFKLLVFYITGLYKMLENHVGFEDVIKIAVVSIISNVVIVVFIAFSGITFMYKSAYFFITIAEIGLITLPRIANRIIVYVKTNYDWNRALGKRTLIVGAGDAGELVVKEIYRNKDLNNIPLAFVDDNQDKIGNRLLGILIVGPIDRIKEFIDDYKIEEVIIAINYYPTKQMQKLVQLIADKNVRIKKLLSMTDVDSHHKPQIIDVRIEDLLNRDEIKLDDECIKGFIKDEIVLVTGGGGSIGSELCRQISELEPKQLIIFDIYENNAYDVQQELLRKFSKSHRELNLKVLIGSVYNRTRLEDVYKTYKPTIVFHAAAYKHVPLMEDSAVEAVRTNVLGTYNASSLAREYNVKKFVLVSSDKAVRSTNVMGATKRYAELIVQEQQAHTKTTKFSAVRFGNVLGSNGSVIPLFKKQIADGGPVTVTHQDITRYFMTIPEAVGLILQCGVYAQGGEVFILDMGEPVRIVDLAEKMISLAGFKPNEDIKIEITGLRPGEKLFEELLVDHNHDDQHRTANQKIYIEKQREVLESELELTNIIETIEEYSNEDVKKFVAHVIPSYKRNGD